MYNMNIGDTIEYASKVSEKYPALGDLMLLGKTEGIPVKTFSVRTAKDEEEKRGGVTFLIKNLSPKALEDFTKYLINSMETIPSLSLTFGHKLLDENGLRAVPEKTLTVHINSSDHQQELDAFTGIHKCMALATIRTNWTQKKQDKTVGCKYHRNIFHLLTILFENELILRQNVFAHIPNALNNLIMVCENKDKRIKEKIPLSENEDNFCYSLLRTIRQLDMYKNF